MTSEFLLHKVRFAGCKRFDSNQNFYHKGDDGDNGSRKITGDMLLDHARLPVHVRHRDQRPSRDRDRAPDLPSDTLLHLKLLPDTLRQVLPCQLFLLTEKAAVVLESAAAADFRFLSA